MSNNQRRQILYEHINYLIEEKEDILRQHDANIEKAHKQIKKSQEDIKKFEVAREVDQKKIDLFRSIKDLGSDFRSRIFNISASQND